MMTTTNLKEASQNSISPYTKTPRRDVNMNNTPQISIHA